MIEIPSADVPFTSEEEAYWELDDKARGACSEAARTLLTNQLWRQAATSKEEGECRKQQGGGKHP